jgi:hypothetical protein
MHCIEKLKMPQYVLVITGKENGPKAAFAMMMQDRGFPSARLSSGTSVF